MRWSANVLPCLAVASLALVLASFRPSHVPGRAIDVGRSAQPAAPSLEPVAGTATNGAGSDEIGRPLRSNETGDDTPDGNLKFNGRGDEISLSAIAESHDPVLRVRQPRAITNRELVELLNAGVPDAVIWNMIRTRGGNFEGKRILGQVTDKTGNHRLSFGYTDENGGNVQSLVWEVKAGPGWIEKAIIKGEDFENFSDGQAWISAIHSFDAQSGHAIIQVGRLRPAKTLRNVMFCEYTWREWDIAGNKEIRVIRKCRNPDDPFDATNIVDDADFDEEAEVRRSFQHIRETEDVFQKVRAIEESKSRAREKQQAENAP